MGHREYVAAQRGRIVALAKAILKGEKRIVPASIEISQLQRSAEEDHNKAFDIFRVIESDMDHLPVGTAASNLSPQKFRDNEKELIDIEDFYRSEVFTSCKRIVEELEL